MNPLYHAFALMIADNPHIDNREAIGRMMRATGGKANPDDVTDWWNQWQALKDARAPLHQASRPETGALIQSVAFELRAAFATPATDIMDVKELAKAAKGAIEQGKADKKELYAFREGLAMEVKFDLKGYAALRDLCAVLNGDGGHRQSEVGVPAAAMEAQTRWHYTRGLCEGMKSRLKGLGKEL